MAPFGAPPTPSNSPQAAVVGIIVTEDFEVFFDTLDSTRKVFNLRENSRIAFVIGGLTDGDERTVQYEGIADEPKGVELERLKERYSRHSYVRPSRWSRPFSIRLPTEA